MNLINFLQAPPIEPQPGFMQQYSFIIMVIIMVLILGGIFTVLYYICKALKAYTHKNEKYD